MEEKRKLPEGWRWARLGDLCEQDRAVVEPASEVAAKLSYLSLERVESNTGGIAVMGGGNPQENGRSATFSFGPRHVLYGKLRPYLNKVALPDFHGRCTTEMIPLLPGPGTNRDYLAWLLRRRETVDAAMRQKTGSRMPRADMADLLRLAVPQPPLEEQKRIAAILNEQMTAVERARTAAEAQLEAAKALPAAHLRAVFDIPEAQQWPTRPVREIAETRSGATPSRSRKEYYGGAIRWIKTGELVDGLIISSEESVTDLALQETSLRLLPPSTLLVAMYGQGQTRGRTGLLSIPATTNQACLAILPNADVFDPRYLQFWFRHNYVRIRKETENRGGNQPNLNGDLIRDLGVALPPLSEQQCIIKMLGERMTLAQQARKAIEEEMEIINKLPAALLRRAFSGGL